MESLKYWLEKIAKNDGELTHWKISTLIGRCLENLEASTYIDLKIQIRPLLEILVEKYSHKHKKNVASFTLELIEKWEEGRKNNIF